MIDVRGALAFDDYARAYRAHTRKMTLVLWAVVAVVCVGIVLGLEGPNRWIWVGALVAYVLALRPILAHRQLKKQWQALPPFKRENFNVTFDEHGIHTTTDDAEPIDQSWQGVRSARETEDLILLYLTPTLYLFVPKRMLTEEELEKLRTLIRRRVEEG